MAKYNGHKNYNCWNVSLYIDNEYPLYKELQSALKSDCTKDEIATMFVQQMKYYFGSSETPDGVKITFAAVREHLRNVDRNDY